MNSNIPRIGTGVIVVKKGKVLIGKRESTSLGYEKYCFPGGHLDFGETILQCGIRELQEEANLQGNIHSSKIIGFTEEFYTNKQYVTFFITVPSFEGTVQALQNNEHQLWEWKTWNEVSKLGDNLFLPLQNLIEKYPDFDPTK